MSVRVEHGDCREVIKGMDEASVDSVVTDPPYSLVSIQKRYGSPTAKGSADVYGRATRGFMGKQWDTGETAFDPAWWAEVYRVLKPGAHLVAFGGTRTYHRMACAIEDAGFEIRDQLAWAYGSGFPKSHNIGKAIDKAAGAAREIVGCKLGMPGYSLADNGRTNAVYGDLHSPADECAITAPATDAAEQWEGWGTALKPAWEPIVLARKPLTGTVAANVLQHGTGALNIDGCRIEGIAQAGAGSTGFGVRDDNYERGTGREYQAAGRWPANLCHDGSEEVLACFPESEVNTPSSRGAGGQRGIYGEIGAQRDLPSYADSGSAARFFFSGKAGEDDRIGSKHPTVKPVALMRWLVRLITPPGGLVLDPFAGTGTTGVACIREGMRAILIEREDEYVADIRRRIAMLSGLDLPLLAGAAP